MQASLKRADETPPVQAWEVVKACEVSSATKGLVGARARQHQRQWAVLGSVRGKDSEARRDATWAG
jgi:hypothetical protein